MHEDDSDVDLDLSPLPHFVERVNKTQRPHKFLLCYQPQWVRKTYLREHYGDLLARFLNHQIVLHNTPLILRRHSHLKDVYLFQPAEQWKIRNEVDLKLVQAYERKRRKNIHLQTEQIGIKHQRVSHDIRSEPDSKADDDDDGVIHSVDPWWHVRQDVERILKIRIVWPEGKSNDDHHYFVSVDWEPVELTRDQLLSVRVPLTPDMEAYIKHSVLNLGGESGRVVFDPTKHSVFIAKFDPTEYELVDSFRRMYPKVYHFLLSNRGLCKFLSDTSQEELLQILRRRLELMSD